MRRRQRIDEDVEGRHPRDVRKIILHRIVDDVRRFDVFVARRVIAELEPADAAKESIEDDLLHLTLGIHLLQRGIGDPLQDLGSKLALWFLDLEKHVRVVKAHRRDDLACQRVHATDLDDLVIAQAWHIEVEVVGLEQATPHFMPCTHILAAIFDAALPELYFFRLHQLNKFPLSGRQKKSYFLRPLGFLRVLVTFLPLRLAAFFAAARPALV